MSKEKLISRLSEHGVQFNKYANMLFEHPYFSLDTEEQKVQVEKVSLLDLDLTVPSIFQEIVAQAGKRGLGLCPLNLAAYLRLEYLDQPEGPYLTVASHKVEFDEKYPRGLYLRNTEGALWLRGYCASDDWEFATDQEFIFMRR